MSLWRAQAYRRKTPRRQSLQIFRLRADICASGADSLSGKKKRNHASLRGSNNADVESPGGISPPGALETMQ
jgi:hypothetical protein